MEHSRAKAHALRRLVAQEVLADPLEWNEAVLGKAPPEYCAWIQQPDKWGGAIELSILSKWVMGQWVVV
jgi:ubiquitin thioesterase OTU1